LAGRDLYLLQRNPFTLGNGSANQVDTSTVASWSADQLNGTTVTFPFSIWEFIGLELSVHGDFGSHGDFCLFYYVVANGATGVSGDNTSTTTGTGANAVRTASARQKALLNMRWSNSLTRHFIVSGSGSFFIPADGPGSTIQGAAHVNIISGSSVLNPNAVLATVTMSAVYAVTGDRI
jgi:hypothetical protein